jgi:DNA-directed RNA polymerase subunit K/omega
MPPKSKSPKSKAKAGTRKPNTKAKAKAKPNVRPRPKAKAIAKARTRTKGKTKGRRKTKTKTSGSDSDEKSEDDKPKYEPVDSEDDDLESDASDDDINQGILQEVGKAIKIHKFDPRGGYAGENRRIIRRARPEDRVTSSRLSQAEMTEVLSHRIKQLEEGGPSFVDYGDETNPSKIAIMEMVSRKCPCSVVRHHNDSMCEVWAVNEMILPEHIMR